MSIGKQPSNGVNLTACGIPHTQGFSSRIGGAAQRRHGYYFELCPVSSGSRP